MNTPIRNNKLIIGLFLTVSTLFSTMAQAEEVNVASNTSSFNVPPGFDVAFIGKAINVPAPRTLVIHYAGECQAPEGYIEYDILVNNSQISPSHDNFSALCSKGPQTVGTVVACNVPAGNYLVRVRGHVVGSALPGIIDDQSLVIEEHAPAGDAPACFNQLPLQAQ